MGVRRIGTPRGTLFLFSADADPAEIVDLVRAEAGLPPHRGGGDAPPGPPRSAPPQGERPHRHRRAAGPLGDHMDPHDGAGAQ